MWNEKLEAFICDACRKHNERAKMVNLSVTVGMTGFDPDVEAKTGNGIIPLHTAELMANFCGECLAVGKLDKFISENLKFGPDPKTLD